MEKKDYYQIISAYQKNTSRTDFIGDLDDIEEKFQAHMRNLIHLRNQIPESGDFLNYTDIDTFIANMTIALVVQEENDSIEINGPVAQW